MSCDACQPCAHCTTRTGRGIRRQWCKRYACIPVARCIDFKPRRVSLVAMALDYYKRSDPRAK